MAASCRGTFTFLSSSEPSFCAFTSCARAYEKDTRDPDDCYLMVLEREEEPRSQGQPSRIGVLLKTRSVTRDEILAGDFAAEPEYEQEPEPGEQEFPH